MHPTDSRKWTHGFAAGRVVNAQSAKTAPIQTPTPHETPKSATIPPQRFRTPILLHLAAIDAGAKIRSRLRPRAPLRLLRRSSTKRVVCSSSTHYASPLSAIRKLCTETRPLGSSVLARS